jgi:hypothetical protein
MLIRASERDFHLWIVIRTHSTINESRYPISRSGRLKELTVKVSSEMGLSPFGQIQIRLSPFHNGHRCVIHRSTPVSRNSPIFLCSEAGSASSNQWSASIIPGFSWFRGIVPCDSHHPAALTIDAFLIIAVAEAAMHSDWVFCRKWPTDITASSILASVTWYPLKRFCFI